MSVTSINTYMEAYITAVEADDWSAALKALLKAKASLIGLPDSEMDGMAQKWDRAAIDTLIVEAKAAKAAASATANTPGGFTRVPVNYVEPTT